jgi:hypothetical protein
VITLGLAHGDDILRGISAVRQHPQGPDSTRLTVNVPPRSMQTLTLSLTAMGMLKALFTR